MISVLDCTPTQNLAKLMNDVFDSLNGRHYKQGITLANMEDRFKPLKAMLKILDITEELHRTREKNSNRPMEMFVSTTTLRGMRIVIHSAMLLTKEMLDNGYSYVLPGKWNQDPVEVLPQLFVFYIVC